MFDIIYLGLDMYREWKKIQFLKRVWYMNLESTRTRCRPRNRRQDELRKDGRIVGGEEWQKILDFKFLPCSESCIFSFGYFPGVRLSFADVSEPSVTSIFKDLIKNILHRPKENIQVAENVYNREERKKLLKKARNLCILHMAME
jgi:hypothetical protein